MSKQKGKKGKQKTDKQAPHKIILSLSMFAGFVFAICVVLFPKEWWLTGSDDIVMARGEILGFLAINMTLAILIATIGDSDKIYVTSAYIVTGLVTFMAAAFNLKTDSLTVIAFVMLSQLPLTIAIAGLIVSKMTRKATALYFFVSGIIFIVVSLSIAESNYLYNAVSAFFIGLYGLELGIEVALLVTGLMGFAGILLVLGALTYGGVQLLGVMSANTWNSRRRSK